MRRRKWRWRRREAGRFERRPGLRAGARLASSPFSRRSPVAEDRSILTRAASAPDQVVAYGARPENVADVRHGGERRPLVVLIHGGFWRPAFDRAHTGPMAAALAQAGWTVAAIEYRRAPGHPDHAVEDVDRALNTLPAKLPRHDGRVLVVGHSAGGHLALWAA